VHELRRLCAAVGVDSRGCLEKSELVEKLATSGRIEVLPDPAPGGGSGGAAKPEFTVGELEGLGVGALRRLMASLGGAAAGLRPETCLEKSDMVHQIVASGTVTVTAAPPAETAAPAAAAEAAAAGAAPAEMDPAAGAGEEAGASGRAGAAAAVATLTLGELNALGVGALRNAMAAHGVNSDGCELG
jgi:hypothetical protein